MIRCVVFDFDGTLVDSNRIKQDTFYNVVANIERGREILDQIFSLPSPGDRYEIFARFVKEASLLSGSDAKLARQYAKLCEDEISSAPEMPGAQATLKDLHEKGLKLFINSATPHQDLQPIVLRRNLHHVIAASLGGPTSKFENLQTIMKQTGIRPHEIAVVGDGDDDRISARLANCLFIPVFEARGHTNDEPPPLDNLKELPRLFRLYPESLNIRFFC